MLTFSPTYFWENDDAVRQILVFPNAEVHESFKIALNNPARQKTVGGFPDENGIGAIYKARAVRNGKGGWDAIVRCGFTGQQLWEKKNAGLPTTPVTALDVALACVADIFYSDIRKIIPTLYKEQ